MYHHHMSIVFIEEKHLASLTQNIVNVMKNTPENQVY